MTKRVQEILDERKNLEDKLSQFKLVKKIYNSSTNFLLVEFSCAAQIFDFLLRKSVVLRDRQSEIENCLRITVGNRQENLRLLSILAESSK